MLISGADTARYQTGLRSIHRGHRVRHRPGGSPCWAFSAARSAGGNVRPGVRAVMSAYRDRAVHPNGGGGPDHGGPPPPGPARRGCHVHEEVLVCPSAGRPVLLSLNPPPPPPAVLGAPARARGAVRCGKVHTKRENGGTAARPKAPGPPSASTHHDRNQPHS